ncbi:conserved hypothetical protein [Thermotomaculum hydrothermale]|uniref:DUF2238 domain-containing protein n=1 Tax=Thermotomaculum hydrothermale TaxID=981385 RepID=A0A7R6PLQ3_9BACT|nr:DUF2238 domain-containing protein [Thermotomaculum hydrothermale]BBB31883.1 conserved hypothetical protein [Thermotomaculum hydrothermale]
MKDKSFLDLPKLLLIVYIVLFVVCAINPVDRKVWFFENITVLIVVVPLVLTYKKFRFSNTAYILMFVWIVMHTIGGHYVFKNVPFDFVNNLFGWERNNYDRVAHFSVGFYAFAIAELLDRKKLVNSKIVLFLFPIFAIFTVASVYEIIEWIAAGNLSPKEALYYVSAQGDIWDAQKDMLCDGLGAILATCFYFLQKRLF